MHTFTSSKGSPAAHDSQCRVHFICWGRDPVPSLSHQGPKSCSLWGSCLLSGSEMWPTEWPNSLTSQFLSGASFNSRDVFKIIKIWGACIIENAGCLSMSLYVSTELSAQKCYLFCKLPSIHPSQGGQEARMQPSKVSGPCKCPSIRLWESWSPVWFGNRSPFRNISSWSLITK